MADPNDGWIPEDEGYEEMDENGEMMNQVNNPYYLDLQSQQAERLAQNERQARHHAEAMAYHQRRYARDQQERQRQEALLQAESNAIYREIENTTFQEFDDDIDNLEEIVTNPATTDAQRRMALRSLDRIKNRLEQLMEIYTIQQAQGRHQHRAMNRQQVIDGLREHIRFINSFG